MLFKPNRSLAAFCLDQMFDRVEKSQLFRLFYLFLIVVFAVKQTNTKFKQHNLIHGIWNSSKNVL